MPPPWMLLLEFSGLQHERGLQRIVLGLQTVRLQPRSSGVPQRQRRDTQRRRLRVRHRAVHVRLGPVLPQRLESLRDHGRVRLFGVLVGVLDPERYDARSSQAILHLLENGPAPVPIADMTRAVRGASAARGKRESGAPTRSRAVDATAKQGGVTRASEARRR